VEYCEKAEYAHLNPVTAGLVKRAEEKPQTLPRTRVCGSDDPFDLDGITDLFSITFPL
jgi:hypothetical protein